MASFLASTLLYFCLIFFLTSSTTIDGIFSEQYADTKPQVPSSKKLITHLHFYFHDVVSGKHPTAVTIAGSKNKFGMTAMIDDPLTEGTEHASRVVGRAQGFYAMSSQHDLGLLVVMNFAFSEGKYNGSSLSILGRNPGLDTEREMPIVGGSGVFRLARGYVLAKTVRFNLKMGDAVVEYNVFVAQA